MIVIVIYIRDKYRWSLPCYDQNYNVVIVVVMIKVVAVLVRVGITVVVRVVNTRSSSSCCSIGSDGSRSSPASRRKEKERP